MAKNTLGTRSLPTSVVTALVNVGRDISIARRRRRISQRTMAERMMINVETLHRLEKGDPRVSLGLFASALWQFGMQDRLSCLLEPSKDILAQGMDLERLPKTIRSPADLSLDF